MRRCEFYLCQLQMSFQYLERNRVMQKPLHLLVPRKNQISFALVGPVATNTVTSTTVCVCVCVCVCMCMCVSTLFQFILLIWTSSLYFFFCFSVDIMPCPGRGGAPGIPGIPGEGVGLRESPGAVEEFLKREGKNCYW